MRPRIALFRFGSAQRVCRWSSLLFLRITPWAGVSDDISIRQGASGNGEVRGNAT